MSNMNKEIEELKKRLEELEKAPLNAVKNLSEEEKENIIPKEEVKKIIEEGVDFDGEIRKVDSSKETPEEKPKKEDLGMGISIAIIVLFVATVIVVSFLALNGNNFSAESSGGINQKDYSNLSDIDRGFTITNGIRAWFDQEKYLKNQERPDRCFSQKRDGQVMYFCDATLKEVEEARNSGREVELNSKLPIILKIFQIDTEQPPMSTVDESQFANMSDAERGFSISGGYRVWKDYEKYEKNQINKERECIPWKWDWQVGIICFATVAEAEEAKSSGRDESTFINPTERFKVYGKTVNDSSEITEELRRQRKRITSGYLN